MFPNCRREQTRRHAIYHHLPMCLSPEQGDDTECRFRALNACLEGLAATFNVNGLEGLLNLAVRSRIYPEPNIFLDINPNDEENVRLFRDWLGETGPEDTEMHPPSHISCFAHWRVLAALLVAAGEGGREIPPFITPYEADTVHSSATLHSSATGHSSPTSRPATTTQPPATTPPATTRSLPTAPDATQVKSLAPPTEPDPQAGQPNPMECDAPPPSPPGASRDPADIQPEIEVRLDTESEFSEESYNSQNIYLTGSPRFSDDGEGRPVRMLTDSHFHIDRLEQAAGDLDTSLRMGPKPHTRVKLELGIANFCDELPTDVVLNTYRDDPRIRYSFGAHPRSVGDGDVRNRANNLGYLIRQHPRKTVGFGEIGLDATAANVDGQQRALHYLLGQFRKLERNNTLLTLVLHCRDKNPPTQNRQSHRSSREHHRPGWAGKRCLQIMRRQLDREGDPDRRVHRHSFNGSVTEMLEWIDAVPNVYFGFSGLVELEGAHREIRHVLRRVPENRILLESDAPHLLPERYNFRYGYNTPFMVMEVAEYIAQVRQVSVERILEVARENTRRAYRL